MMYHLFFAAPTFIKAVFGCSLLVLLAPLAARAQTQDLFVTNVVNSTISRFAGIGPGTFATTSTTLSGGLAGPNGLAFDAQGDLFTDNSSGSANTVTKFAAGPMPGTFGAATVVGNGLNHPAGLAFDAQGDLFAANQSGGSNGRGTLTKFTAGTTSGTLGVPTTLNDPSLKDPSGLAFDARGDLFVANQTAADSSGNNNSAGTIEEFAVGPMPGTFGAGTIVEAGLSHPTGLAFDAQGDLFAASFYGSNNQGTIKKFAAGLTPGTFGATTTLTAPSLNYPSGLAFDARGDLFVANLFGNSITEFALNPAAGLFAPGMVVETGLSAPAFLAFGPSAPIPEASTSAIFGLLLALGIGGGVIATRRKKSAQA